MYAGLHVNYALFLWDFKELEFSRQSFQKYSNIKFYENPSSGCRDVSCGQTDRHVEHNSRVSQFGERA
jgi:hypothetical protein